MFQISVDPNRIYGLDILRALAIIFVVITHGNDLLPEKISVILSNLILDGVSIFFVLSGFLIGRILIKLLQNNQPGWQTLSNFWIRRWFRTLPNYFLVLIILAILHLYFSENFKLSILPEYILFIQNITTEHPWFFPEAWSLSIEEWFYLIVPIFLVVLMRVGRLNVQKSILIVAVGIILFITFFRYIRYSSLVNINPNDWDMLFRKQVITRLDSIMYGVVGAYLSIFYYSVWYKYRNIFMIIGCSLLWLIQILTTHQYLGSGLFYFVFSFSVTSLGTLSVLPFLSNYKNGKGIIFQSLTYISLISYSMYLINLTLVHNCIIEFFPWPELKGTASYFVVVFRYLCYWGVTILLSLLLYKYFELPMMKIRDRIKF